MTPRQQQIYEYIRDYIAARGHAPSFEEIGLCMGLASLATVSKHVLALEAKGLIVKEYGTARSIRITDACPTCGQRIRGAA